MENLRQIFEGLNGRFIQKWDHYIEIYDRYFSKYRNREVNILEVGISQGGSLEMWKKYFGNKARIFGVDINPHCKTFEDEQVAVFIGKQEDRNFWKELKTKIPKLDILVDDGGHTMQQQIVTFEEMFDHVKEDGVYLCEDTHTSYMYKYHGGYKKRETFIEYSKNFIDFLHGYPPANKRRIGFENFEKSVNAIHFYRSMVIIEKQIVKELQHIEKGQTSISGVPMIGMKKLTSINKLQKRIKGYVNRICQ